MENELPEADGLDPIEREPRRYRRADARGFHESGSVHHERARLLELLDDLEAVVWRAEADDWRFTFVSAAAERLLGVESERLLADADGWIGALHPDDREAWAAFRESCGVDGDVDEFACRTLPREGRTRRLRTVVRTLRDDVGRPRCYCGLAVDVTGQDDPEGGSEADLARARAERERLDELFIHAPAAIAVTEGADHVVAVANPRFLELLGDRPTAGRPLREAAPELVGQEILRRLDEVQLTGRPYQASEVPVRVARSGGEEEVVFDLVHQPLGDEGGWVSAVMTHAIDVTDRVHHREALAQARAEAERANRAKSRFLAAISHDLRTPLNAVSGYASLVAEGMYGPVEPVVEDVMARIKRSSDHLLHLIDGILGFAKLEAGSVTFTLEPLGVEEELGGLASLVEPQLQARGLTYDYVPGSPDVRMLADKERLTQVLLNVLTNAIKFTEAGGITVRWEATDSAVDIHVLDTGRGISGDQLADIFEPFVQTGEGGDVLNQGIGLGLAISRELARGMGGDLTVESELGKGSTFTLSLPRA